jgi:hypothetical protein
MKKTDLAMIILIASISIVVSYLSVKAIPALQFDSEPAVVKKMNEIPANYDDYQPDPDYFNEDAINPTVEVFIGDGE